MKTTNMEIKEYEVRDDFMWRSAYDVVKWGRLITNYKSNHSSAVPNDDK